MSDAWDGPSAVGVRTLASDLFYLKAPILVIAVTLAIFNCTHCSYRHRGMCNCFCFFLSLRMLISVDFSIFYLSIYLPPLSTSVCLSWIYLTAVLFVLSSFVLTVPSSKFRVVVPSSRSRPSHPIPSHRSPRYPVSRVRSLSSCQWSMFCSVLFSMIRLARIRNITNAIPPRPHPIPSPFSFPVCQSVEPEVRPNYHRACAHAGDVTTMGARASMRTVVAGICIFHVCASVPTRQRPWLCTAVL